MIFIFTYEQQFGFVPLLHFGLFDLQDTLDEVENVVISSLMSRASTSLSRSSIVSIQNPYALALLHLAEK